MPLFRILPVLTNKVKKMSQSAFKKAGQSSVDWFKGKVTDAFGKKKTRTAGAFSKKEVQAQQQAMEREQAKYNRTRGRSGQARTPEQEVKAGQRSQRSGVAQNDPTATVQARGRPTVKSRLKQNTTMDAEFKRNLRNTNRPMIGHMYFYIYDPKWKKILPYYDVFPLVIPIEYYPDGFLGMNLHYLPYILRAKLLDHLFSLEHSHVVNGKPEKYMAVSYGILKSLSNTPYFEPTIKRYLYSHVKSPFAEVLSDEWENAAFLPVEQFRKANKREVWQDARNKA